MTTLSSNLLNDNGFDVSYPSLRTQEMKITSCEAEASDQQLPSPCFDCSNSSLTYHRAAGTAFTIESNNIKLGAYEISQSGSSSTDKTSNSQYSLNSKCNICMCNTCYCLNALSIQRELPYCTLALHEPIIPYTARSKCYCRFILLVYVYLCCNTACYCLAIMKSMLACQILLLSRNVINHIDMVNTAILENSQITTRKMGPLLYSNCRLVYFDWIKNLNELSIIPRYLKSYDICLLLLPLCESIIQKPVRPCKTFRSEWGIVSPPQVPAVDERVAPLPVISVWNCCIIYNAVSAIVALTTRSHYMTQHHGGSNENKPSQSNSSSNNLAQDNHELNTSNHSISTNHSNSSSGGDDEDDRNPRKILSSCQLSGSAVRVLEDEEEETDDKLKDNFESPDGGKSRPEHPVIGAINSPVHLNTYELNPQDHPKSDGQSPREHLNICAQNPPELRPNTCSLNPPKLPDIGAQNALELPDTWDQNPPELPDIGAQNPLDLPEIWAQNIQELPEIGAQKSTELFNIGAQNPPKTPDIDAQNPQKQPDVGFQNAPSLGAQNIGAQSNIGGQNTGLGYQNSSKPLPTESDTPNPLEIKDALNPPMNPRVLSEAVNYVHSVHTVYSDVPGLIHPSEDDDDSVDSDSGSSDTSMEHPNPSISSFSPRRNSSYASVSELVRNLQPISNSHLQTPKSHESGPSLHWDKFHEQANDFDMEISFDSHDEQHAENVTHIASNPRPKLVPTIEISNQEVEHTATCTKSPEIKTPHLLDVQRIKKSRKRHNSSSLRKKVLISNASAVLAETPKPGRRRYFSECLSGRDRHPVTSTPIAGTDLSCLSLKDSGSYFVGNPVNHRPVIFVKKFLQTQTSISELCINSDIGIQQRLKNCFSTPIRIRWDDIELTNGLESSLIADILSPGSKIQVENGNFGSFYLRRLLICVNRLICEKDTSTSAQLDETHCNSMTILKSEDFGKVLKPFHLVSCQGIDSSKAIAILSFGGSRSLNMIPKSHKTPELRIADIELCKGSLLIIPPEIHDRMKIYYPPDSDHTNAEQHYSIVFFTALPRKSRFEETPCKPVPSSVPVEFGDSTLPESKIKTVSPANNQQLSPVESGDLTLPKSGISTVPPASESDGRNPSGSSHRDRNFLSNSMVVKVINTQPSKTLIDWIKLCDLKPLHSAEANRQILIEYLTSLTLTAGIYKLSPPLIEKITQKLNDDAITEELLMQGISPKKRAKTRKKQLQSHLIDMFTSVNLVDRLADQNQEKNMLNCSRKRTKAKRRSENKRRKKIEKNLQKISQSISPADCDTLKSSYIVGPLEDVNQTSKCQSHKEDVPRKIIEKNSNVSSPVSAFDTPNTRAHVAQERIAGVPLEPKLTEHHSTSKQKTNPSSSKEATVDIKKNPSCQTSALNKDSLISELEKPLKTLENSIIKIQDTLNQHSSKINHMFESVDNNYNCACKLEETIAKNDLIDAQNQIHTLLETVKSQQASLSSIPEIQNKNLKLESALSCIQTEMNDIKTEFQHSQENTNRTNQEEITELRNEMTNLRKSIRSQNLNTSSSCMWQKHIQSIVIGSDHSYSKSPSHLKGQCHQLSTEEDGEISDTDSMNEPLVVLDGTSIEIGANTAISDHDIAFKSPPKPISILRSQIQNEETSTIPIVVQVGPSEHAKPQRSCVLVHMNPHDPVSERLSEVFSIQCLQYETIEEAAKSRELLTSLQITNPEIVFLHLGFKDLRNKSVNVPLLADHYKTVIQRCLNKLPSKICISLLTTSNNNFKLNKITTEFNESISKVYNDLVCVKPELSERFFLEESHFVAKGIGEKCTLVEKFLPSDPYGFQETRNIPVIRNRPEIQPDITNDSFFPLVTNPNADRTTRIYKHKSSTNIPIPETNDQPSVESQFSVTPRPIIEIPDTAFAEDSTDTFRASNRNTSGQSVSKHQGRYHKRKCLVVHDSFFDEFDRAKFSNTFDVELHKEKSLKQALRNGKIFSKISCLKPEAVFIHVGLEDIYYDKTSKEELIDLYKQLIYKVLECSDMIRVCVSLIIPITGHPELNELISEVNEAVTSFITWLRSDPELKNSVFSSSNIQLSSYIAKRSGSHGIDLFLTDRGQRKLWLITRDSLQRTLSTIHSQQHFNKKTSSNE